MNRQWISLSCNLFFLYTTQRCLRVVHALGPSYLGGSLILLISRNPHSVPCAYPFGPAASSSLFIVTQETKRAKSLGIIRPPYIEAQAAT